MERIDLKTGYLCNNNCYFCAQAHNKKYGNKTTEELKKILTDLHNEGTKSVIFTGGEFTIRKDCLELVKFAREIGYDEVQLQSNGRMFSNEKFVEAMMHYGVTEFSPALHGYLPEIHDYLTRAPGAFDQVVKGIKNIKAKGGYIVANSVVVKPNYRYVPQLSNLFVSLGVDQYQFAFVHSTGNTALYFDKMMPFVSLAAPFIKRGIQIGISSGKLVMAEAMPYCVMQGFERYVSELYIPPTAVSEGNQLKRDFEKIRKVEGKTLFEQCKECRFRLICEGPWKEYPDKRGSSEFRPVPGKLIQSTQEIFDNEDEFPKNPEKVFGKFVYDNNFRINFKR